MYMRVYLKSGAVHTIDMGNIPDKTAHKFAEEFYDQVDFGSTVSFRFGECIFYAREVETIKFMEDRDAVRGYSNA